MSNPPHLLSLSVKGLQRLEGARFERDFAFVVGDERHFCPSFVAEFLSPRVSSLRSQDITIKEFSIETEDAGHHFGALLSIGFGREVSFSQDQLGFVRSVCGELWNCELFEQTLQPKEGEMGEAELKARLEFLRGADGTCDYPVAVVASHFDQFSVSDFDKVSRSTLEAILSDPALVALDEDSIFEVVHRRASEDLSYFGLLELVRFEFLSGECMKSAVDFISRSFESLTFGIWSSLRNRLTLSVTPPSQSDRFKLLPAIDSQIISTTPRIFSVFRGKTFRLLYRGSRDGFEASTFHSRCNGHPNNVTLILSTNNCIFGGYTPLAWSSRASAVPDPSLTSFLFTIRNPHNLPAQIFRLRIADQAIYDYDYYGPVFGGGNEIYIYDKCSTSTSSSANLGTTYANNTGIDGNQVLAGAQGFTVKEIEVFDLL
jgi:hypothetical protein